MPAKVKTKTTPPPAPARIVPAPTDDDLWVEVAGHRARRKPHPDRRTYIIASGDYEHERVSRLGITTEAVVADQLYQHYAGDMWGTAGDEDRAIWQVVDGVYVLRAVIRPRTGSPGNPVVHVFKD